MQSIDLVPLDFANLTVPSWKPSYMYAREPLKFYPRYRAVFQAQSIIFVVMVLKMQAS